MLSNNKYTTVENIAARIGQKHKQKSFTIDELVQWCAECVIEIVGNIDVLADYTRIKCVVTDNKALLPCNIYRLLDVFDANDNRYRAYTNDGTHIIFNSSQSFNKDSVGRSYIMINYRGIAVDPKTGFPLIPRGQELACEAYCVWNLYYEDYLNGRLNGQQWSVIDNNKIVQCEAAKGGFRHFDNEEMRRYLNVVVNMIPNMRRIPLYHLNGIEQ